MGCRFLSPTQESDLAESCILLTTSTVLRRVVHRICFEKLPYSSWINCNSVILLLEMFCYTLCVVRARASEGTPVDTAGWSCLQSEVCNLEKFKPSFLSGLFLSLSLGVTRVSFPQSCQCYPSQGLPQHEVSKTLKSKT